MSNPPTPPPPPGVPLPPPGEPPPTPLLHSIYEHLPMLAVQLTVDGIVLHCNPETERVTGYERCDLIGRNFWALLFPGKLFAQVPRFISPTAPSPLLRDTPMTLRTKQGLTRVVAFTRFVHVPACPDPTDVAPRTIVCLGVDLTDRLIDADKVGGKEGEGLEGGFVPFGPNIGNAGAVDGEIVTPLAISPPALPVSGAGETNQGGAAEAIRQAQDHLSAIDGRMMAVRETAQQVELSWLESAARCGRPGESASTSAFMPGMARLEAESGVQSMQLLVRRVEEIVALYRPERR